MSLQDTINAINALDCPEACLEGMVYQVWEDGEITLQKGGSLLWQRSLHCIDPGDASKALPVTALANQHGNHSFIWAINRDTAVYARQLILGEDE